MPALYAAFSAAWIAGSDLLLASVTRTPGQAAAWSIVKGFGFIGVTAVLLHAGLRWALSRERRVLRRLQEQLALKDRLAKLAVSVPGLIYAAETRPDGAARLLFATPAIAELFGFSQEELAEDLAPWTACVHPDDLERVRHAQAGGARGPSPAHEVYRYCHPRKGLRWVEGWTLSELTPDGGFLCHGFAMDVTDRVRLGEQFQQAQKLESIGRLAGGIAHDFNNILTVILSCADGLRQDLASGAPASAEDVEEIRRAGDRARELTRKLLAVARRQVIEPVPLNVNDVVRDSEKLLRRLLNEDIALVVNLQPDLRTACCDPAQIEQIVLNLTVNARDAMPGGGKLVIETSNFDVEEMHAAVFPGIRPGPYVRLAIQDSGIGMPPEVRARLFEPFFTTKEAGKGTGLGLATVYGIVSQSGGYIRVESEPGYGTAFELLFPAIRDTAAAAPPVRDAPAAPGNEIVLLVEDDPHVRAVTTRALRSHGYEVLPACNGLEALEVVSSHRGGLDLLVTDVIMPGVDGRRVAESVRKEWPDVRVLFVSGHSHDVLAHRGVLDEGIDLLQKPYTPAALLARVREVLDASPRATEELPPARSASR